LSGSPPQSPTPKLPDSHSNFDDDKKKVTYPLSPRFVEVLGWVITCIWALSMFLHALNIGYEPPPSIHVLMMVVAGAAFGTNFIKPRNGA
jgi:hypothetical protein